MVIQFFGTKTDSSRTGHEVLIKKGTEEIIDPVQSMKDYLSRAHSLITQGRDSPFFSHSQFHFRLLVQLNEPGYLARSFRPTEATAYVASGVETHVTRSLRRWRSEECFNERYVYPLSSTSATDKMLNTTLHS